MVYTDGAAEIFNAAGEELMESGLAAALKETGIADLDFDFNTLERKLLEFSNNIRLPDDLTILRVIRTG